MKRLFGCLLSLFVVACVQTTKAPDQTTAPVARQPESFSHSLHYQKKADLGCVVCHSYSPQLSDFQRPAHKQCAECHPNKDFTNTDASNSFCRSCHAGEGYNLYVFPRNGKGSVMLADFNHQAHLNPTPANQRFGVTVGCVSCHELDDNVAGALSPAHKQCAGCHGASGGAEPAKPSLMPTAEVKDCLGCHLDVRQ